MELILKPFSALLLFLYEFLHSYGLALIVFSLLIKVILFPFSLKGKKSMIQMNMMQGKMQQLQKQYGKDKARYNEELQKLYEKEKINPMGGCLWSLLPMIVLILLYYIIRQPLQYLMGVPASMIDTVAEATGIANTGAYPQIAMANAMNDPSVFQAVQTALGDAGSKLFALDFSFLGIDLSQIPQWKFWTMPMEWATNFGPLVLVIISVILSFLSMWISQKTNKLNNQSSGNAQADRMTKQMMIMMPLMSVWIGFIMPAGLCVYWIANSVFTMLQELLCGQILKKDYAKAAAARAEQERLEKEEQKRLKAERAARIAAEQEEAKKNKGKKKPAAPKPAKKKESTTEEGRVGIRPYARGRSYDPNRFGGVTEYHDADPKNQPAPAPQTAAVEETKEETKEEPVLTAPVTEENTAPAAGETTETAEAPKEETAAAEEKPTETEEEVEEI